MRKKKRLPVFSIVFLMLLMISGITAFSADVGMYDQAELFSEEEKAALMEQAEQISTDNDMNMIIVTTNDAEGKESREYADDFYMDYGFYENGADGGTLFLIDMDNREVYMSNSGDMIYYITDSRTEDVIDAGYEQLKEGAYGQCITNMLSQTQYWIQEGIPADQYTYDEETGEIVRYLSIQPVEMIIAILIALLVAGIICGTVVGKYRLKWGGYKYDYRAKSKLTLKDKEDRFRNQVVTQRRVPKNPPSSGGSDGSRTTTHTSSGGGTFSGGGRGF